MPQVTELEKGAPTKVQDGSDNTDSDSEESVPELEDAGTGGQSQVRHSILVFPFITIVFILTLKVAAAAGLPEELVSKAKQSRGEKKARKIMSKLGLKQVEPFSLYV